MSITIRVPTFIDDLHQREACHTCLNLPHDVAIGTHPRTMHILHYVHVVGSNPDLLKHKVTHES
jgi:hypothetical protein